MSLASQLQTLQARQQSQTQLLHQRVFSFANTLNQAPADFIRQHPYAATGTAAALAFLLAQTPLPSPRRQASHPPPPPRTAPSRFSLTHSLLPLLLDTLQAALFPHPAPHLTPANAGTLHSHAFPHPFPAPPTS